MNVHWFCRFVGMSLDTGPNLVTFGTTGSQEYLSGLHLVEVNVRISLAFEGWSNVVIPVGIPGPIRARRSLSPFGNAACQPHCRTLPTYIVVVTWHVHHPFAPIPTGAQMTPLLPSSRHRNSQQYPICLFLGILLQDREPHLEHPSLPLCVCTSFQHIVQPIFCSYFCGFDFH